MRTHRIPLVTAVFTAVLLVFGALAPRVAHADPKKDIQQKIKEAMESYDLLDYEEARKSLNQALSMAKRAGLDKDPVAAQVHLRLGIVLGAGLNDTDGAKKEFAAAAAIDSHVEIDVAYKTADLEKMLDAAKAGAGGGGGGGGDVGGGGGDVDTGGGDTTDETVDCKTVTGLQHTIIDTAKGKAPLRLVAFLGRDVRPSKVSIMYRAKGAVEFKEMKMTKSAGCRYTGQIPAKAMTGDLLHYYIAAYNGAGKVIASKGSSGSPNIVEVQGGGAAADDGGGLGDDEDPLHAGGGRKVDDGGAKSSGGAVSGGVHVGGKHPKVFITIGGGTGGGYVTGTTEQAGNKVECCFAPALAHLFGEIGYYVSPTTSISVAGRFGFVLGANIPGHSPGAPAGLIRLRHALSPTGTGVVVTGAIGAGVIRNTIKLTDAMPGVDVDVAAMGPMLLGGGVGYVAPISGAMRFDAEINALAGIPIKSELGSSHLVFGIEFDATLGLQFGF